MLYEKLNPEMQQTVDAFAARLADLSWERRSDALARVAQPFSERFDGDEARLAGKGFLTAVLERLDDDRVDDFHQAILLLLSLNPAHRARAEEWLELHPELADAVRKELSGEA